MAEEKKQGSKEVTVPAKFTSIVSEIEKLSVLDLAELVKVLEDKFGVSAAAPIMVGVAATGPATAAPAEGEAKTSFNVELTASGSNKIGVIKAIREFTQVGLKEAKDIVDGAPKMIKEEVDKKTAEEMKKKIEDVGGKVSLT